MANYQISNIGYCSKRRFKNYIESARNYHKYWEELVGINTSNQCVNKFTKEKEKIIKNIVKLGTATERRSESEKIQKYFNNHPDV